MATATPCLDQQTACPPHFCSRSSWGRTHGSAAALRGQRRGPANGRVRQEMSRRCWRRAVGPSHGCLARTHAGHPWLRGGPRWVVAPAFVRASWPRAHGGGLGKPGGASPLSPRTDGSPGRAHTPAAAALRGRGAAGLEGGTGAPWGRGRPAASPPCTPDRAARPDPGQQAHARVRQQQESLL
jgi:hypothetical protein